MNNLSATISRYLKFISGQTWRPDGEFLHSAAGPQAKTSTQRQPNHIGIILFCKSLSPDAIKNLKPLTIK
ncbi:hypothetical protein CSC12_0691 [Klebsiella michiganensis]|nr:hypothetical protein CSC12_0691 [Klebsiella michiganensis]